MSLHNDINNLTKTLENNQQKLKQSEKQAEKRKNLEYQYKIELLDDLRWEFDLMQKYNKNLLNREVRNEIIESLLDYSVIINNKNYTKAFLIENYEKEAKKIIAEEEKQYKIKEKQQKELEKIQTKQAQIDLQKRQDTIKAIMQFIQIICLILLSPFILIIFFVLALAKNSK